MGTAVGVGQSFHKNPAVAGREAAVLALRQAGIETPDFVLVFATVGYNQRLLIDAVRQATSDAPLCGCTGEGIITRGMVAETNFAVCVLALRSDDLRFRTACVRGIDGRLETAGAELADAVKPLVAGDSLGCFLFADGLVFNYDPFISSFESALALDRPLPLFGGLAADNWTLSTTYQYHNGEVFSEGICCVVMSGKGDIAWGVNHGCVPVGAKRTVTRARGNVICEIDGVPALDALREYLEPDWAEQWNKASLNLCLGFKTPEPMKHDYEEYIVRYMMAKDDEERSVTIQSEVEEGTDLWMVRRDKELITSGLEGISRQIKGRVGEHQPKFVLQFECVGRGKVVFREGEKLELIEKLQSDLGEGVPWVGFYTYGEIGPIANGNCFHNFTSVVAAVY